VDRRRAIAAPGQDGQAKSEIPSPFASKVIEIFIFVSKEMATGTQTLAIEA